MSSSNQSTIKLYNYNRHVFTAIVGLLLFKAFSIILIGNFGIRTRIKCFDLTISCIFIVIRLVLLVFLCHYVIGYTIWVLINTYDFKLPNSPFASNDSVFNSIVANIFWHFFIIFDYLWISLKGIFVTVFWISILCTPCYNILENIKTFFIWMLFFLMVILNITVEYL